MVGLSNISNSVPAENRSLINRVFLAMLMGAGVDAAIVDALDVEQNRIIQVLESARRALLSISSTQPCTMLLPPVSLTSRR